MTGPNAHLNSTIGQVFIGVLFSAFAYGLTCAQSLYYVGHYRSDQWVLKSLVSLLWLLDTIRIALVGNNLSWYLIQNHNNMAALERIKGTFRAEHIVAIIVVLIVQCYFILSIWRLVKPNKFKALFTVTTMLLVMLSVGSGVGA